MLIKVLFAVLCIGWGYIGSTLFKDDPIRAHFTFVVFLLFGLLMLLSINM